MKTSTILHSRRARHRSVAIGALLSFACGGEEPELAADTDADWVPEAPEDTDDAAFRIEIGTNDTSSLTRNAVALVGGCTGTLVAPDLLITAAHCGYNNPAYFTGGWTTLPAPVYVGFGPLRASPIYTTTAVAVSGPPLHTSGPAWVDDIVLLRLAANVPSTIATPRGVILDHPAPLLPSALGVERIYEVGYGGIRDRRVMAGGDYEDWLSDPGWTVNSFTYVPDVMGPGIGERGTNIEHGDSGGPMLLGSDTGLVMGVLTWWDPIGIATYGPGTGGRSPIRTWLMGKLPTQRPDFRVVSIQSGGCTGSGGDPVVAVTIRNAGAVMAQGWVDVFTGLASAPPMGTYGSMFRLSEVLPPEGTQTLSFAITDGFDTGYVDVLLDTVRIVTESNENNNASFAWVNLPDCSFG